MKNRDQAAGLRERLHRSCKGSKTGAHTPPIPVVAVASGKGGAGKTLLAVNLALALREIGRRVLLVDLDPGMADADIFLGVHPRVTMEECLAEGRPLSDAVMVGPGGLLFLPGASGTESLAAPDGFERAGLWSALADLGSHVDLAILDTGAGISQAVIEPLCRAHSVLLVTNPDPAAITDAYALLKILHLRHRACRVGLVVNRADNQDEALLTATRLRKVAGRFLGRKPEFLGWLPENREIAASARRRAPFLLADPTGPATKSVRGLAARLLGGLAVTDTPGMDGYTRPAVS